jgi:KDO2-lipid IV(A) lauroyltransferase
MLLQKTLVSLAARLFELLAKLLVRIPQSRFLKLGRALGSFLYLIRFRRKLVHRNLEISYSKSLDPKQRHSLEKRVFQNTGLAFLEIWRNFGLRQDQAKEMIHWDPESLERVRKANDSGRGVIFLGLHLSNWEINGVAVASQGFDVYVVVKKMKGLFAQIAIEKNRKSLGWNPIYAGRVLLRAKELLEEGKMVGFVLDQHITGKKGIRVPFFGRPAKSIRGISHLARESGSAVLPIFAVRDEKGTYSIHVWNEIPYEKVQDENLSEKEKVLKEEYINTLAYSRVIEAIIRRYPDQWLWIHDRWKADQSPLDSNKPWLENKESYREVF